MLLIGDLLTESLTLQKNFSTSDKRTFCFSFKQPSLGEGFCKCLAFYYVNWNGRDEKGEHEIGVYIVKEKTSVEIAFYMWIVLLHRAKRSLETFQWMSSANKKDPFSLKL